jgi:adenosyl cobinamide kinase/adenosyl cobinamide phosphate guanylyltransferase
MAPGLTVEELYHRVREHYRSFITEALGSPEVRRKVVMITSDVASGIAPQEPTARIFRQSVAEMNLALAAQSSKIIQIELGIPRVLK